MTKVPATVITGFLGAGKTTLVRHLLRHAGGRRIAVLLNEFGDVELDDGAEVAELTNGCICCTVADDLLPAMQALLDRPSPPDHIVIEASGLALPKTLVKAFQWTDLRTRAFVDGVIAVIDADALAAGRCATDEAAQTAARAADPNLDHDTALEELFAEQLACADLVVLSKTDLVEAEALAEVEALVAAKARPGVRIVHGDHGAVDAADLLGIAAGS